MILFRSPNIFPKLGHYEDFVIFVIEVYGLIMLLSLHYLAFADVILCDKPVAQFPKLPTNKPR
jgi:hypothetical protein